jgi:hypothetical protein
MRMDLSLTKILRFCRVYVLNIWRVTDNSSLFAVYKSSASPDFAKQILSILLTLQWELSHFNGHKLDDLKVPTCVLQIWFCLGL